MITNKIRIPELKISASEFGSILIAAYLILNLYMRFIKNNVFSRGLCIVFLILGSIPGLVLLVKKNNKKTLAYLCVLLLSWCCTFNFKNGVYDFKDLIYTICYIGMASLFLYTKPKSNIFMWIFYLSLIIVMGKYIYIGGQFREILIDESSYNYISVILIAYFGIYYILRFNEKKEIRIIHTFILFIICLLAYGRGGIITSASLFFMTVSKETFVRKMKKEKALFLIVMISIAVLITPKLIDFIQIHGLLGKFTNKTISNEVRLLYWKDYLFASSESLGKLMLGADPFLIRYDGNLHNSFLQMYAYFGMPFFLMNVYLLIKVAIKLMVEKDYYKLILLTTIVLRGMTDKTMFRGITEIVYFYYIFEYFVMLNRAESYI